MSDSEIEICGDFEPPKPNTSFKMYLIKEELGLALKEATPYFELVLKLARQYYEVNGLDDYVEDLADDLDCSFEQVEIECKTALHKIDDFVNILVG